MAMYCPRCGSYNPGQTHACISCLGPLAKGQSVQEDARCATHSNKGALGRCMTCSNATCFDCGSTVDGRILCFNCATLAATTTEETAQEGKDKKKKEKKGGFSLGKKK